MKTGHAWPAVWQFDYRTILDCSESAKVCKIKGICSRSQLLKFPGAASSWRRQFLAGSCLFLAITAMGFGQQHTTNPRPQAPAAAPDRGQVPKPPPTTGGQKGTSPEPSSPARPQTAGAPVDSDSYKVGPSDILYINVWHEQEFSGPVSVHEDGKITMPLVGDLQAGGKTPKEIEKIVADALSKYVVKPLVTVTVQDVLSKKYYLDGEVNRPGEYPLVAPTTVLEAISKASGLAMFANEKKIYILRGNKRIPFNYKDVIRGKHMEQNILLKPDDHVIVP
jgi:polysaccharide biosynthesis/export protein